MTAIRRANAELAALAAAVREDWAPAAVEGAILTAQFAGWSWERTLMAVVVLMTREDGEPRDLVEATRDPLNRTQGAGTDPTPEYMAAKNAIEHGEADHA
jgi:hypothetical protein